MKLSKKKLVERLIALDRTVREVDVLLQHMRLEIVDSLFEIRDGVIDREVKGERD